jgi:hypothetical protein
MNKIAFLILLIAFEISSSIACTTAVISGKYTKNGRPLLWKHRDTWAINNKIMQFSDGKYECTGLVNSGDSLGKSVWIGFNSTGFAIMNSASYNLNNDTVEQSGLEGKIIKQALQNCATIDEFENMLKNMQQPTRLEANFGVIDANGGAAYFELANYSYTKVDANNPAVAPFGYLIRTNYSFSGKMGKGGGYIRYVTANNLFDEAVKENELSAQTILQKAGRSLTHSLTGDNLWDYKLLKEGSSDYVWFVDFIPRSGSSSSVVVEGINPEQNPMETMMWNIIGFPLTSVIIPVWQIPETHLPQVVEYNEHIKDSPICHLALKLKENVYSYKVDINYKYYINLNSLLNSDHTGYLQVLPQLESEILAKTYFMKAQWELNGFKPKEINDFYKWINTTVLNFYETNFPQLETEINQITNP